MKFRRRDALPPISDPQARRKARMKAYLRRYRREWKIWGIVALCLTPLTYDGLVHILGRIGGFRAFVESCRESPYCELWYAPWGDARNRLSMPLGEREQRIWDGVVATARAKGFVFREPEVRQTTLEADRLRSYDRYGGDILGMAYSGDRILLNSRYIHEMPDEHVAILMAHELGHRVDHQTERVGHKLFDRLRYAHPQDFADGFAAYLYGQERLEQFDRWRLRRSVIPEWRHIFDGCRLPGICAETVLPSDAGGES